MTQPRHPRRAFTLLLGLLLAACSGTEEAGAPADGLPATHPPLSSSATAGGAYAVVLETMDAAGYTYARVAMGGDEMWTAGPQTPLAVGDTLSLSGPMPMSNFTSNTLDRTFDVILFVDAFTKGGPPTRGGTVIQAIDAAGYTYLEVETDGGRIWLAGPQTAVAEGDVVAWEGEMPMRGFRSSTLERTFDEILFVGKVVVTP